jgi:hypothetical protein
MANKTYTYIKTTNNVTDSKFPLQKYNKEENKWVDVLDKDGNKIPQKNVSLTSKQMEKLGHAITSEPKQYAQFTVPAYLVNDWKRKDGTLVVTKDSNGNEHKGYDIALEDKYDVYITITEVVGKDENGKNQYDYKKNPKVKVSVADLAAVFALPEKNKDQAQEAEADKAADVEPEAPELD